MKRKVFLISMVFLIIVISISCSKNDNLSTFDSIKKNVNAYVQYCKENKDIFQTKEVGFNDISSEGGIINGYYFDNQQKYIKVGIFGEMGKKLYYIYFVNELLTYFVITDIQYDKPIYEEDFKVLEEDTNEYVIIKGKMFKYEIKLEPLDGVAEYEYKLLIEGFKEALKDSC